MKKYTEEEFTEAELEAAYEMLTTHPELFEHLREPEPEITDPNLKYASNYYQPQPQHMLVVDGKEIPMREFALYATRDLTMWEIQPSYSWLYRHMITGETYEVSAEYGVTGCTEPQGIIDVTTNKVEGSDKGLLMQGYIVHHSIYKAALRRFRIQDFFTQS